MRRTAAAALLLVALVACGGDDDGATTTTSAPSSSTTAPSGGGDGSTTTAAPPTTGLADVAVRLTPVASLTDPTAMAVRPGGDETLYVTEQEGRVVAVDDGGAGTFLDIRPRVASGGERGLLGLAFSPAGDRLYVSYTNRDGDSRIDEYRLDGDVVDEGSRREVLAVDQPAGNHNGGNIVFGPDDRLWFGLGDGGGSGDPEGNGQDTSTLLGSLLRIDPLREEPYAVPDDNPFVDGGGRPEIWAYGLRNPWRFSFDRETQDLWIADVGQDEVEEIDVLRAADGWRPGANLGWNRLEGTQPFEGDPPAGAVPPVFEYGRDGGCSVTGGFVYRGSRIPDLVGAYVFADYCAGELRAIRVDAAGAVTDEALLGVQTDSPMSFGEDAAGELYVLSGDGLLRLDS